MLSTTIGANGAVIKAEARMHLAYRLKRGGYRLPDQPRPTAPPHVTPPFIVALAGPPGSGKTTVATAVAERVAGANILFMDGFDTPAGMSIEALDGWLDAGADFAALEIPGLAAALAALKAGRSAVEPRSGRRIAPAPVILFEMSLGRTSPLIAPFIDRLVWIDTPLDIALARNVLAFEADREGGLSDSLSAYLRHYLAVTRRVLEAQARAVAPTAELTVDGRQSPGGIADQIIAAFGLRP